MIYCVLVDGEQKQLYYIVTFITGPGCVFNMSRIEHLQGLNFGLR